MALNFPSSPTNGQIYTSGNSSWAWDSASSSWKSYSEYFGSSSIKTINGNSLLGSGNLVLPSLSVNNDYTGLQTVTVNSTSDALRITQEGTGNAIVVEDSTNPDATPFVVNADGRLLVGHSTALTFAGATAGIQNTNSAGWIDSIRFGNVSDPSIFRFIKSRGTSVGTNASVANNDQLGAIGFYGADGTSYIQAGFIQYQVDGTPATNSMPARLTISTTPSGSNVASERMRITSEGNVLIGNTDGTSKLTVTGTIESTTGGIKFPDATTQTTAFVAPSGSVVGTTDTQTLTNKRINPRVSSTASITSPLAWNSDDFDQYVATAQASALTISADSGTPVNGQKMLFRFEDNGTARALAWTTGTTNSFRAIGVTLPTTTVISKTMYIGCIYNSTDSRWDVIAVAQEA